MSPTPRPEGSRYPWSEAPAWARYASTDEDGWRWWWGALPDPGRLGMWRLDPNEGEKASIGPRETTFCVNWRGSLESRPRPAPSDPSGEWVRVPREPTPEMMAVALGHLGVEAYVKDGARPIGSFYSGHTAAEAEQVNWRRYGKDRLKAAYAAMLTAAPSTPASREPAAEPAGVGGLVDDAMVERGLIAAQDASDARLPRYKVVRAILESALASQPAGGHTTNQRFYDRVAGYMQGANDFTPTTLDQAELQVTAEGDAIHAGLDPLLAAPVGGTVSELTLRNAIKAMKLCKREGGNDEWDKHITELTAALAAKGGGK